MDYHLIPFIYGVKILFTFFVAFIFVAEILFAEVRKI